MALNLGSMFAWLSADTSGLDKGERRMNRFVGNTNKGFNSVSRTAQTMGRVLGVAIGAETIRRAANLADEYKGINSRIKNVTKEAGTFYAVQKKLIGLSLDSGGSLLGSASLFANIDRAAPEIGSTQKQALQLTETLNKLAVLSGASSTQMKDGMLQFSQAMAAGIVRAEEWNSIMENMPEVGNRIAQGMGTTVGALRLAILDGKVLSKDVFQSLLKQSEQVNEEFAEMPTRMGMGFEAAKTGAMVFLGQLDEQMGLTTGIGEMFKRIGAYLSGDFREGFFVVYDYTMRIIDGLYTWKGSIQGIRNIYAGLGGDSQTMAQSIGYASSLAEFLADAFVKIGPNIKFLWNMTKSWIVEAMIYAQELFSNLKIQANIFWEYFKMAALKTAAAIAGALDGMFAGIIGGIQSATYGLGDAAAFVGMVDKANNLYKAAGAMNSALDSVNGRAAELEKGVTGAATAIAGLTKEKEGVAKHTGVMLGLLEEERDGYVKTYDAEIKAIKVASDAREKAFKDKQDQRAIDEAAAQEAFNSEQARAAAEVAQKETKAKGSSGSGKDSVASMISEAQSRFDALQQSLFTERELEDQYYKESLEALNQAEALKLDSIIPYHELRERMEQQHQDALLEIERSRLDQKLNAWGDFFGNLSSLQDSESKKLAAIGKAAAITQVLIDTARAAMASYAYGASIGGPYLGLAFAAAAGVAGGVQLAAIRSAKATGGEVGMGGAYRVNEQGPELLEVGGQSILMMGSQGGKITPNSELGSGEGGASDWVVKVYNLPGQTATAERTGDRELTIRMAVDQAKKELTSEARTGNGTTVPAILAAGGVKRKAS